ncbi:Uncharacterized membrane protein YhaH, DUF805 family [Pseudobutyrivibrio sp. YE44]|uniref:DUF805 domain-containing protein n=1 Tax=Pseudobutyrivibrio sp. YE44 TaxID=1520802 RepID=UPI00087EE918|nr:DUF805 domain-containing protein [Pseudobutyrivibrio sp. YE44]SDB42653.1 Uncharacterized membrane protein YhaH, DUF805 family [Pseudobutyrivibrio sp. YE44]
MKKYFDYSSRIRRREFFKGMLVLWFVTIGIRLMHIYLFEYNYNILVYMLYFIVGLSSLSFQVRRLHDIGMKGWIALFPCITITLLMPSDEWGGILTSLLSAYCACMIYLFVRDSSPLSNEYGDSPKPLEGNDIILAEINNRKMINIVMALLFVTKILVMIGYAIWFDITSPLGVSVMRLSDVPLYILASISFIFIMFDFTRNQKFTIIGAGLSLLDIPAYIIGIMRATNNEPLKYLKVGQILFMMIRDSAPIILGALIIIVVVSARKEKKIPAKVFFVLYFVPFIWGIIFSIIGGNNDPFFVGSAYETFIHTMRQECITIYCSKFVRAIALIVIYNRIKLSEALHENNQFAA